MTPPRSRSSPFPGWSLPAALLRVSVTLGALVVLGALFVASVQRSDLSGLKTQSSHVQHPLTGVRHLTLTLSPQLSHTLRLSSSGSGGLRAQLSASREDELRLQRAPLLSSTVFGTALGAVYNDPPGSLALKLSRRLREWPLMIQLDGQSGLPGTLALTLPQRLPLTLMLQRPADDSDLDLRYLSLERLNFVSDKGQLRATLPERGQPQLSVRSTSGDLNLTLPPGDTRTTLDARSESGNVTLNVPSSARVSLTVQFSGPSSSADVTLPASFQPISAPNRQSRRYLQPGRPAGPALTARLDLKNGSLIVNTLNANGVSP